VSRWERRLLGRKPKFGLVSGSVLLLELVVLAAGQPGEWVDPTAELHFDPLPLHPSPSHLGFRLADRAVAVEVPGASQLFASEAGR